MREIEGSSPDRVNPKAYVLLLHKVRSIEEKGQILLLNQDNVSELGNMYIPGKLALYKII